VGLFISLILCSALSRIFFYGLISFNSKNNRIKITVPLLALCTTYILLLTEIIATKKYNIYMILIYITYELLSTLIDLSIYKEIIKVKNNFKTKNNKITDFSLFPFYKISTRVFEKEKLLFINCFGVKEVNLHRASTRIV
jgi:hypothetical protein